jgi:hypothetical protein
MRASLGKFVNFSKRRRAKKWIPRVLGIAPVFIFQALVMSLPATVTVYMFHGVPVLYNLRRNGKTVTAYTLQDLRLDWLVDHNFVYQDCSDSRPFLGVARYKSRKCFDPDRVCLQCAKRLAKRYKKTMPSTADDEERLEKAKNDLENGMVRTHCWFSRLYDMRITGVCMTPQPHAVCEKCERRKAWCSCSYF